MKTGEKEKISDPPREKERPEREGWKDGSEIFLNDGDPPEPEKGSSMRARVPAGLSSPSLKLPSMSTTGKGGACITKRPSSCWRILRL